MLQKKLLSEFEIEEYNNGGSCGCRSRGNC